MSKQETFFVVMKVSSLKDSIKVGNGTIELDWGEVKYSHYLPVFKSRADAVKYADGNESLVLEAQSK